MKRLLTIATAVVLTSFFAAAENIDGTLAVDAGNKLTNVQPTNKIKRAAQVYTENKDTLSASNPYGSSDPQLSAGIDDVGSKTEIPATSVPITTSSYMEGPFVGLEISGIIDSEAEGKSTSGMAFGLRFGAQNIDWRTMAILERYPNTSDGNSYYRGLLQLDYFFFGQDKLMIDTYGIRPYAGLNAGLISLDTDTDNVKSLTYGAQIGATMSVTNNIDVDLGYKYNLSSSDRIDHTSGITFGLNYKY